MVIVVADATVRIDEPEDCKSFKVVLEDEDETPLEGIGWLVDRDTAWVSVDAVRRLAAGTVDDSWEKDFAAMIEYARTKGWIDDTRGEIQAHVER